MDICFWCELRCPESQKGNIAQCIHLRRLCPALFPSPSCSGDQSPIIHSKPPRTHLHLPPIHPVSHSFIPSPRDPCKHQPFIANGTYNSIFDTFRSVFWEEEQLIDFKLLSWTCFRWILLVGLSNIFDIFISEPL